MRTFLSQKKYKPKIGTESGSETLIMGHDNEMRDENILGLKDMIGPEQTEEFLKEKSNNGTELDKTVMGQEEKIEEQEEKIDGQEKTLVGQCENVISQENNGMGQSI